MALPVIEVTLLSTSVVWKLAVPTPVLVWSNEILIELQTKSVVNPVVGVNLTSMFDPFISAPYVPRPAPDLGNNVSAVRLP